MTREQAAEAQHTKSAGQPLPGELVDHAFRRVFALGLTHMIGAGQDTDDQGDQGGAQNTHGATAAQRNQNRQRHRDSTHDGAGCEFEITDAEHRGDHGGGARKLHLYNLTVAVAWAAMPSRRPVKPRPSVVVAFTLTRSGAIFRISAIFAFMASRCGPTLGRSQMMVRST